MKIFEVYSASPFGIEVFFARDAEEAKTISQAIQYNGGIPFVKQVEVPDNTKVQFALKKSLFAIEPSMN